MDQREALSWLAGRLAWERRLEELREDEPTDPTPLTVQAAEIDQAA